MNSITFPYMYATYTMCYYDFINKYPNAFDNLHVGDNDFMSKFWGMFNSYWTEYEINGETIPLFIMRVSNTFISICDYWHNKITTYEKQLIYEEGIKETYEEINKDTEITEGINNTNYIDLPNKISSNEYISNKTNNSINGSTSNDRNKKYNKTGGVNVIDQREKYLKYLNNMFLDFVKEFKGCFIQLYT